MARVAAFGGSAIGSARTLVGSATLGVRTAALGVRAAALGVRTAAARIRTAARIGSAAIGLLSSVAVVSRNLTELLQLSIAPVLGIFHQQMDILHASRINLVSAHLATRTHTDGEQTQVAESHALAVEDKFLHAVEHVHHHAVHGATTVRRVVRRDMIHELLEAHLSVGHHGGILSKVLTDGPISRINFCTIPDREIGAEMPVYGKYDDEFKEQLKPYIENLCQASGLVDCPEAFELARKLKEENADFARMSQDRVFENLSFRANVIAYLKACVLYVANGYQWEPEIDEFIRWSEQYDLYCKMRYFGEAIARMEDEGEKSSKRGPSNLLQLLPDTFSFQQVEAIRLQYGKSKKGTTQMLRNWIFRKYIRKVEPDGKKENADFSNFSNFSFEKLRFRVS